MELVHQIMAADRDTQIALGSVGMVVLVSIGLALFVLIKSFSRRRAA